MNFGKKDYFQKAHNSQSRLSSQNSRTSSGFSDIDDIFDLDKPPVYRPSPYSVPKSVYPSQSKLFGSTQTKSDIDSGFDSTPKQSLSLSWSRSSPSRFQLTQRHISSQSTVSINSNSSNSLNETQTTADFTPENGFDADLEQLEETFSQCCSQERRSQNFPLANVSQQYTKRDENIEEEEEEGNTQYGIRDSYSSVSNESQPLSESATICEEQATSLSGYENINSDSVVGGDADDDVERQPLENVESDLTQSCIPEISPILNLYTRIREHHSDCAFVYALASLVCKDVYPKHSHITLKTALLLSIVSCNSLHNAQPISIMALTRDSEAASTIMRHIGNYAKRFIFINDDLKFADKRTQAKPIESNSLLMARNGVCYIGDWLGLKPASLTYLQNVIDSGRVTVETTSNIEFPLNCSIWMYWTCAAKKMSQNHKDLASISKLFGIPIVLDEMVTEDFIDFIFAKCTGNQNTPETNEGSPIDENAIKMYLNFVSEIPTEFNDEAMAMLKYYFIVTRAVRPNILTPKSFDILQCLSECHARLCLRTDVLRIDVIFAIELFEQFVLNVFADQVMTKPMSNVPVTSVEQVDDYMREFEKWLDEYLSSFNQNVHNFFRNE